MITDYDEILLQITTANLLQITTILLQTTTANTNCDKFITNYYSYYKLRQLSQITTEQSEVFKTSCGEKQEGKERSALVKFWRAKGKFKMKDGALMYNGRKVSVAIIFL